MDSGEPLQAAFPLAGQPYKDTPAIRGVDAAAQGLQFCHPIHQFDGRVVPDQEIAGEIAHGDSFAPGKAPDGEQGLMLPGSQARAIGGRLAERLEFPQFKPKAGKRFVIDRSAARTRCGPTSRFRRPLLSRGRRHS